MDRLASLVYRLRYWTWAVVLLGTAALWVWSPPVQFEQSVEGFFPPDHPALLNYRKAVDVFGEDNFVFVAYDDPALWSPEGMARVRRLADSLRDQVANVDRVDAVDKMPLPWKVDDAVEAIASNPFAAGALFGGLATVKTEVASFANDPQKLDRLRKRVCSHPLFNNFFVDRSGGMVAVVVRLQSGLSAHKEAVEQIRAAADAFAAQHHIDRIAVVGPPVLVVDGFRSLDRDNETLALAALGLMVITMLAAVRSPFWAILPLVAGWVTWQITKGFIGWFDLKLTLSSGPIVAQTVVLCMPAASHLAIRFHQAMRETAAVHSAARRTLALTFTPVAWCSVTAAAGYLATCLSSTVVPVVQMGLTMFVCNLLAGLLTYCLAGGAMSWQGLFHRQKPASSAIGKVSERLGGVTSWFVANPVRTLLYFALPCVLITVGMSRLELESNYVKIYRQRARVVRDYNFVERRMGGIGLVEVVFPAPTTVDSRWVADLQNVVSRLAGVDPKLVAGAVSPADVLGLSGSLTEGKSKTKTEQAKADRMLQIKLRLLALPANSYFLRSFWNRDRGVMRVLVRVRESAAAVRKQKCFAKQLALARREISDRAYLTGLSYLMTQITGAVLVTASHSALWSCGIILMMLLVALRSVRLALLSLAPTLLAVGSVLGVMGWLGLKIDMSTAIVASVAIGLSVDDSFHCLLRWKSELRAGRAPMEALRCAYAGAGPGVVLSSSAVSIGFLALLFSEFIPTANFGWLIAVATLGGSIGNLAFIPASLALLQRFFGFAKSASIGDEKKGGDGR